LITLARSSVTQERQGDGVGACTCAYLQLALVVVEPVVDHVGQVLRDARALARRRDVVPRRAALVVPALRHDDQPAHVHVRQVVVVVVVVGLLLLLCPRRA
jgi:hypothetical protein